MAPPNHRVVPELEAYTKDQIRDELLRCSESFLYFIITYLAIYEASSGKWIPFALWKSQIITVKAIHDNQRTIILKARQLGLTWLCIAYGIWLMLFRPAATFLIFSRRDDDAVYLLDERLKGMYFSLPSWMQSKGIIKDNEHVFQLSNGSTARSFPTTAGDSYTATYAMVDEADLVPDLSALLRSVQPTVDTGGKITLLSKSNKDDPLSLFKNIYREAKKGKNDWCPLFLPWHVRPERTQEWYQAMVEDSISKTGTNDDVFENYPATDQEAMAPRAQSKRISPVTLLNAYEPLDPLTESEIPHDSPRLDGLYYFKLPEKGVEYAAGGDPAEGNPNSDYSVCCIVNKSTGEEVALLRARLEPEVFAANSEMLCAYYNGAAFLPERNNHGHTVIAYFRGSPISVVPGLDSKPGWSTQVQSKARMYDFVIQELDNAGGIIHSEHTFTELGLIEGATLKAPNAMNDDCAIAFSLALLSAERGGVTGVDIVKIKGLWQKSKSKNLAEAFNQRYKKGGSHGTWMNIKKSPKRRPQRIL